MESAEEYNFRDGIQFYSGMGYMEEPPISRRYRNGHLLSIGAGADEIMLGIIAKYEGFLDYKEGVNNLNEA